MQFDQEHPYYTLQKSYFIAAVGRKEIPVLAKQQNNSGQNESQIIENLWSQIHRDWK